MSDGTFEIEESGRVADAAMPTEGGVHGQKLEALLRNIKLPEADKPRVRKAQEKYSKWIAAMNALKDQGNPSDAFWRWVVNAYTQCLFSLQNDANP